MSAFGGKADMTVRGNPGALRWPDYRNKDWPDAIKIVHHKTGATLWHPLQEEADARGGHWSVLTLEPMHASVDELFLNLVKIGPHGRSRFRWAQFKGQAPRRAVCAA
jgi:hypothetical protein